MHNILYIDTTNNKEVVVSINNDKKLTEKSEIGILKAQVVLPLIEKLLSKNNLTTKDINEIIVNPGPGSFTGIRVGLSVANALGFTLGIKVNKKEQEIEADYSY
jgi:tRNA threonylcarbamoyladenosine biosynthesis protein TsaB